MSEVRLRIVNITDVYKLNNFPFVKTLIEEKKKELSEINKEGKLLSILTGDFLAPYLLSSIDKGTGMIETLNSTPIDIVIFGNHEDDLEHPFLCSRISDFKGTWINTNMQSFEMFHKQKPYEIVEVHSADKSVKKKIGFIGILSNSPSLYRKGAFNGAVIEDPWETIAIYKKKLEEEEGVDLIIPLCHLYVPQDRVTCEKFDFPLIFSGHDHHVVNEVINNTLLLKAGADAENAITVDIIWNSENKIKPEIKAVVEKVNKYKENEELAEKVKRAYSILDKLRNTELCKVPEEFLPLSSVGSRSKLNSVSRYLWSMLREALNRDNKIKGLSKNVHSVVISGGNIRGEYDYPNNAIFSIESLKNELQDNLDCIIVPMPGHILLAGLVETHQSIGPGYLQFDNQIQYDQPNKTIISINKKPFDENKVYLICTTLWDIFDSSSAWKNYFKANLQVIPPLDSAKIIYSTIISHFAYNVWKQIWQKLDVNNDGILSSDELNIIDTDHDGKISKKELASMMRNVGFNVDDNEVSFVDCIMEVAGDTNKDGYLSSDEITVSSKYVNVTANDDDFN